MPQCAEKRNARGIADVVFINKKLSGFLNKFITITVIAPVSF